MNKKLIRNTFFLVLTWFAVTAQADDTVSDTATAMYLANEGVMVVQGERERLIPFVQGPYVKSVDLVKGEVIVDWDPDF